MSTKCIQGINKNIKIIHNFRLKLINFSFFKWALENVINTKIAKQKLKHFYKKAFMK